jgi:hypothetical protein
MSVRHGSIVLCLAAASAACLAGAFVLPFARAEFALEMPFWMPDAMAARVRAWLVKAGRIPIGDQYLWGIIRGLFRGLAEP